MKADWERYIEMRKSTSQVHARAVDAVLTWAYDGPDVLYPSKPLTMELDELVELLVCFASRERAT